MANENKTLRHIKKALEITSEQHQLIVGSCLGDLHIQHRQNKHSRVHRLRFAHSPDQAQLVDWKYSRLRSLCVGTKPPHREEKKGTYNFYTSWLSQLTFYHSLFYEKALNGNWVKRVPHNIKEHLRSPLSLAVLFMDDGTHRDHRACRLCTQSFSDKDHDLLIECLRDNFGILARKESYYSNQRKRTYSNLVILRDSYDRFMGCVAETIKKQVPQMAYKLVAKKKSKT